MMTLKVQQSLRQFIALSLALLLGTGWASAGVLVTGTQGVTMTGIDGIRYVNTSGVTMTGIDGVGYPGANSLHAAHVDGVTMTGIDGVTMTGIDGVTMTGIDGTTYHANSVLIRQANGVTMTGIDGGQQTGLQSLDPELAIWLDRATDDSNVNCVVVYHQTVTDTDITNLQRAGINGGTRYRKLPMVTMTATADQLLTVSQLAAVRSIYKVRTLQWSADSHLLRTGVLRARADSDLRRRGNGEPYSGNGVTVAVLDTGLDATHADVAGRVARNVKLADMMGASAVGFHYPVNVENLPNTDQLHGHGTFVGGIVAGSGSMSGGEFAGVAPGARLLGLSAGDVNLFHVLAGFDYLLQNGAAEGVRVVNCSFSANTVYDTNDPVNIATWMLTRAGVNVVFSAGNTGPGPHTLNPYAVAPWVVSVGATDERGRLSKFSSRGDWGSQLFRPTLVAPGENVVGLRSGLSPVTGVSGAAAGQDTAQIAAGRLPFYTTASGTSFSAPQVSGTIALMLEANPSLSPAQIRDILQRTATPLPLYYGHEVGAGALNAHAAVLEAAFPHRRAGLWRATLDQGQVTFVKDAQRLFSGMAAPGAPHQTTLTVPEDALSASFQIAWRGVSPTSDLGMKVYDPRNTIRADANVLNVPGLTGKRESATITAPMAGAWSVRVAQTVGLVGAPQEYYGVMDVTRITYAPLKDLDGLSDTSRDEIRQMLHTFGMLPEGKNFRPGHGVSRGELAATLVRTGRAPQYLPGYPTYSDVTDTTTMNYVESVQHAPEGAFFPGVTANGRFRPDDKIDRATAAVVLVRAAGLRAEAENFTGGQLIFPDWNQIPLEYRNYVSVALRHGLLTAQGSNFRPQVHLTRAELAHAMTVIAAR